MMNNMTAPVVVFAGTYYTEEEITFAQYLVKSSSYQIVVVRSPSIHEAFIQKSISHLQYDSISDIMDLMKLQLQLVVCLTPSTVTNYTNSHDCSLLGFLRNWTISVHSFLRSSTMNFKKIVTIVDGADFSALSQKSLVNGIWEFSDKERIWFSKKALKTTSSIDALIMENFEILHGDLKKVLLVGNGGREHAISWKLSKSPKVSTIYVAPGNGGTESSCNGKAVNVNINVNNHEELVAFALENSIDLCVVGPEAPLVAGLADKMNACNIPTFGPSQRASQLEASKAFSKDLMSRCNVPTARYSVFTDYEKAVEYVNNLDYRVVVKASGIAAGKGVLLPITKEETLEAIKEVMLVKVFGSAGDEVVIEEFLEGEEVSFLAFSDGENIIAMPGAQDHKRIFDNDEGPNTGGMGAYAPAPCFTAKIQRDALAMLNKIITTMKLDGSPYVGVLYAGLILTVNGPYVLEFNCRFGDPEAQVLLPLLDSDLYEIMMACATQTLDSCQVHWKSGAAATIVLASEGYPESYPKGKMIQGIASEYDNDDVIVFQAGTKQESSHLLTNGGRVLAVSSYGDDLKLAVQGAYKSLEHISFDGMQYRNDIGLRGLLHQAETLRIGVLGSTRGSSLQPILDAISNKELNARIEVIVSDKSNTGIMEKGRKYNIESMSLSSKGKSRDEYDKQITNVLKSRKVDLVLLIGYMRILSKSFCKEWKNQILNIHPSLLPDFAGGMDLQVHEAVIKSKIKISGCTVHFVTEDVDEGPIVVQKKCNVCENETSVSLKEKVQKLEGSALIYAIKLFQGGILIPKSQKTSKMITYADAGVSIDAGNALVERIKPYCKSTQRIGCDTNIGGFGGLFDLQAAGYSKDTILVACTDGVGTKLKIAQMLNKVDSVGIDLVAMCVNDLLVQGAEPLFFLDYYACGLLDVNAASDVVKGIAMGCQQAQCGLIGGETAEMPSMYPENEFDLAGFCVGAVDRHKLLPKSMAFGDIVLGISSSGIHSNGYSLVRKIMEKKQINYQQKCTFNSLKTFGEIFLEPTKIYVESLLPLIKDKRIQAMAHITGGGLTENIPRILNTDLAIEINGNNLILPPVFEWIQKEASLSSDEMLRTFNCGIGMVVVIQPENVEYVIKKIQEAGEQVVELGHVTPRQNHEHQVLFTNLQF